jgi:UDP-MurNAc hydroxylase
VRGNVAVKITSLGHAGLSVETACARVVVDPWFDPHGAFLGSWFPYPDNTVAWSAELLDADALVISHEHFDHVDPWFIAQLPPTVPAFICRFPSGALRRKILSAGDRPVIEVDPWTLVPIVEDVHVLFAPEVSPMNHDSAVVLSSPDSVLVDLNDARLSPLQLRALRTKLGRNLDVLALQGAGASWYPICYEYTRERRKALSREKRHAKLAYVLRAIEAAAPVVALPFGGPPCFLDPELAMHNEEMREGIFPDQATVASWLRSRSDTRVEVLLPGEVWDTTTATHETDCTWAGFEWSARSDYLCDYAMRRRPYIEAIKAAYPTPQHCLWPEFEQHFRHLLAMSPYFLERIDLRVGFDVLGSGGGRWSVDFRGERPQVYPVLGDCEYIYRFDSRWLPSVLSGALGWEDFLLSLRFSAARNPDVYNDHLLGLLKFATPPSLAAVEAFEHSLDAQATIMVTAEGQRYRTQRTCPHAGNDLLETGELLPGGVLRCLAHHYEFDLETGQCVNASCKPLFAERVDRIGHDAANPMAVRASPPEAAAP